MLTLVNPSTGVLALNRWPPPALFDKLLHVHVPVKVRVWCGPASPDLVASE